jgi:aminoglycoside phosphotransferase (APT) family kinase protein
VSPEAALADLGKIRKRKPFEYATSWPIEEVTLERTSGDRFTVLVKRLEGTVSKPAAPLDSAREATVYRVLHAAGIPAPVCHANGPNWLVLEKVEGVPLWQCGEIGDWRRAASWAASLHRHFAASPPPLDHMLEHDRRHYAAIAASADIDRDLQTAAQLAIDRLLNLPRTLIHGELYPSNVLVAPDRLVAVDWEMASFGPGVIDLAALVTGFDPDRAAAIIDAYGAVDLRDVAAARLLLGLQWLGWSSGWAAPPQHRRDWLAEARAAAEAL